MTSPSPSPSMPSHTFQEKLGAQSRVAGFQEGKWVFALPDVRLLRPIFEEVAYSAQNGALENCVYAEVSSAQRQELRPGQGSMLYEYIEIKFGNVFNVRAAKEVAETLLRDHGLQPQWLTADVGARPTLLGSAVILPIHKVLLEELVPEEAQFELLKAFAAHGPRPLVKKMRRNADSAGTSIATRTAMSGSTSSPAMQASTSSKLGSGSVKRKRSPSLRRALVPAQAQPPSPSRGRSSYDANNIATPMRAVSEALLARNIGESLELGEEQDE